MITANAVLHGDRDYLLGFDEAEHPVALQLGGADPKTLAQACSSAGVWFVHNHVRDMQLT
jgi:tRNA-dihydrouridine synthase A